MPQTAVNIKEGVAFAGMLGDASDLEDANSYTSQESSSEIAFGTAVVQGSATDGCNIPSAQSGNIVGVVLHSHAYQKNNELGTIGLKPKVTMSALTRGKLWVPVTEAVALTDAVRVFMSGANAGQFCKTSSAGVTKVLTSSARWLFPASGAGVALLEIDVNNRSSWTND